MLRIHLASDLIYRAEWWSLSLLDSFYAVGPNTGIKAYLDL